MSSTGREIHVAAYTRGGPEFRVAEVSVRPPGPGEVLVRNTWTSVDPGLRVRLRAHAPEGYFDGFEVNAAMDGILTVGEVMESRADGFAAGDHVWHAAGWRDYATIRAGAPALGGLGTLRKIDAQAAPPQAYLGPLGGIGLTAYVGLLEVAGLRDGDVVWVSAAAGAVGSIVAQIAKLRGHTVIGSAGSAAKVAHLLDDLRLDAAFNHRDGPVADLLRAAAPDGIDVYFDNVGGDHLEAAIGALRRGGRAALCGAVSEYDADEPRPGPANLFRAVTHELTLRGFRGSAPRRPPRRRPTRPGTAGSRRAELKLHGDRHRRPRTRAGGARADARRPDDREDARPDRLSGSSDGGHQPAVRAERRSDVVARVVRDQEGDGRGDLLRLREAPRGRVRGDHAAGGVERIAQLAGVDVSRGHRVDAYALHDQLFGGGLREAEDAGLRRRVVRMAGAALQPADRGHVHDHAAPAGGHQARGGAGAEEGAVEVDGEQLAPLVVAEAHEGVERGRDLAFERFEALLLEQRRHALEVRAARRLPRC